MRPIGGEYDEPAMMPFKIEAASPFIEIDSSVIISFDKNPSVSRHVRLIWLVVSTMSETYPVKINGGFAHRLGAR
jgi:hypothetical protein